jgi:acetyltransferase
MLPYLRPLISPGSVALVGASERPGSVGRIALENLLAGGFAGPVHAINPGRSSVLGRPALRSLRDLAEPVDLAIVATPSGAVPEVLADAGASGVRFALVMTAPPVREQAQWNERVRAVARAAGVRVVGAGAFGIVRTGIGLNATFCAPVARRGRLALVAQSGAVATALLDFAAPQNLGFSTVISLGTGLDIGFGEMLDVLGLDAETDGILMYVEEVADARTFVSALRGAARTKPVIVLKAGRSLEPPRDIPTDRVFDAALARAGAVRVHNYTALFAAARILASGRIPRHDRLAIVSNGRGPALLAADRVMTGDVTLAALAPATVRTLAAQLPEGCALANPVDVRGDATPARLADAVQAVLDDPGVDAVVALHVPRPAMPAVEAAQALAGFAERARKPLLGAWLGALDRADVHAALEAAGIVNFYTPENAVDAFSFLAAYRRSQELLLEVPELQPEPEPLDLAAAEALRAQLLREDGRAPTAAETRRLLAAFGIELARCAAVADDAPDVAQSGASRQPDAHAHALVVRLTADPVFGPVISVGAAGHLHDAARVGVTLPPLNARIADDLVHEARRRVGLDPVAPAGGDAHASGAADIGTDFELVRLLLRLSTLAAVLPWVVHLELDVAKAGAQVQVRAARLRTQPARAPAGRYAHMAIHPYPVELVERVALPDATSVTVRPIRPEDGMLEREFVDALSPQTRFFRFFHQLAELTPPMIARFTQVDYDRELALVAVADAAPGEAHPALVGVARYIGNPDAESAEFAVVVADAWQGRGVARVLMLRLIEAARRRGYRRLEGAVLRENQRMLAFTRRLGFGVRDDPEAPEQAVVSLELAAR